MARLPGLSTAAAAKRRGATPDAVCWRSRARIAAAASNACVIFFIYASYLAAVDWERFGRLRPLRDGESPRMLHHVLAWDLDSVFGHLRSFSFSTAMLPYLDLYMVVGVPGAAVHIALERDRITCLQALVQSRLPRAAARRAAQRLEMYFWSLLAGTVFFLFLARIHIDMPLAHYFCSGCGLLFTTLAISLYLSVPVDLPALLADERGDSGGRVVPWAARLVLGATAVCFASALWKCECLGNDYLSLTFGVLETLTILGYQLVVGSFAADDRLVDGQVGLPCKVK